MKTKPGKGLSLEKRDKAPQYNNKTPGNPQTKMMATIKECKRHFEIVFLKAHQKKKEQKKLRL